MKDFSQEVFQRIDDYLLDRMSAVDKTQFETEIASDAELKKEVDFQNDMVSQLNGMQANRIKAHLNSIPVSTTSPFLRTHWIATYAAIGVIALGVGVFKSYTRFDDNPNTTATSHNVVTEYENYYEGIEGNEFVSETSYEATVLNEDKENGTAVIAYNIGAESLPVENRVDNEDVRISAPKVTVMDDGDQNVEFDNQNANEIKAVEEDKSLKNPFDVAYKGDGTKRLKYKFWNDKLYLWNITDNMKPYVIYERKTEYGSGTEFFIEISNKFYKLDQNKTEKTRMEEITNQSLITELKKDEKGWLKNR